MSSYAAFCISDRLVLFSLISSIREEYISSPMLARFSFIHSVSLKMLSRAAVVFAMVRS